jgi:hypothetical protein
MLYYCGMTAENRLLQQNRRDRGCETYRILASPTPRRNPSTKSFHTVCLNFAAKGEVRRLAPLNSGNGVSRRA